MYIILSFIFSTFLLFTSCAETGANRSYIISDANEELNLPAASEVYK